MADYTRRDGSAMRTDAQRRARQMQQRVPGRTRTDRQKENISSEEENADENNAKKEDAEKKEQDSGRKQSSPVNSLPFGFGAGLDNLLEHIDTDRMLIIALLAMIYKDGGNKKLMMALAYLLT